MIEQPAADFSVKPTLTGGRVVLRPFLLDQDAAALREMLQDPEALKLTGSGHGGDLPGWDDTAEAEFRGWYGTRNAQPDRLDLTVVDKATGRAVVEAVLNDWNDGNRSCNFRILLGPRGRDHGLGTEATRLIVGYGFERLGLNRIELQVYAFNPRARRVYENVGFVVEGVLREVPPRAVPPCQPARRRRPTWTASPCHPGRLPRPTPGTAPTCRGGFTRRA